MDLWIHPSLRNDSEMQKFAKLCKRAGLYGVLRDMGFSGWWAYCIAEVLGWLIGA